MKHIPFARLCEVASSVNLKTLPNTKPGDLRMPLRREQAAEIIVKNAINGSFSLEEYGDLTIEAIEAGAGLQDPGLLDRIYARTEKEREESLSAVKLEALPEAPLTGSHLEYIENLLVPRGKEDFLSAINDAILDKEMYRHVKALDALRNLSRHRGDHCYEWVIQGKLGDVLSKLQAGNLPGYKPDWIRQVVRTQARCLAWFIACQRVRILRRLSTKPYDTLVEGVVPWPTVSHSCLATMIAPANLAMDRLKESATEEAQREIAKDPEQWLKSKRYLPDNEASRRICFYFQDRTRRFVVKHGFSVAQEKVEACTKLLQEQLNDIARAKVGHLKLLGWTKMTYPEFRLGVTASEGTAFVATQLQQALDSIDERTGFQKNLALTAQYKLFYIATLLRGTIEPDKNSAQIGKSRKEPDEDNRLPNPHSNAGALPFRKMEKTLKSSKLRSKLKQVLGFTADRWFLPKA